MRVLLVEPNYKKSKNEKGDEFPPLGLMKLSTFHKLRNDKVVFFKGSPGEFHKKFSKKYRFGRIYISTDFSFRYKKTLEAINLAKKHAKPHNIYLGGVGATLLKDRYKSDTCINVIDGLLDSEGKVDLPGDYKIDSLTPDYSILKNKNHKYQTSNAYFGYATRGCVNRCGFCGVPKHEPYYVDYIDIKKTVNGIREQFGEKKDLILLDNNVLASKKFDLIISDIKELGFERDAKFNGHKKRIIDFNQGLDARLLTDKKAKLLSEIAIKPARIAFDYVKMKKLYVEKIKLMAKFDVLYLSNYLLYNYQDAPEDLYERIMINIQLNEDLGTKIYSFPMKFIPLDGTDRSFVSNNWTKKELRAIQVILHATRGKVGLKREFNETAFGPTVEDFKVLLWMPEWYIMYREDNKDRAEEWRKEFGNLSDDELYFFKKIVENNFINKSLVKQTASPKIRHLLRHYELLWGRLKHKEKISKDQKYLFEYLRNDQRQIAPSCVA